MHAYQGGPPLLPAGIADGVPRLRLDPQSADHHVRLAGADVDLVILGLDTPLQRPNLQRPLLPIPEDDRLPLPRRLPCHPDLRPLERRPLAVRPQGHQARPLSFVRPPPQACPQWVALHDASPFFSARPEQGAGHGVDGVQPAFAVCLPDCTSLLQASQRSHRGQRSAISRKVRSCHLRASADLGGVTWRIQMRKGRGWWGWRGLRRVPRLRAELNRNSLAFVPGLPRIVAAFLHCRGNPRSESGAQRAFYQGVSHVVLHLAAIGEPCFRDESAQTQGISARTIMPRRSDGTHNFHRPGWPSK